MCCGERPGPRPRALLHGLCVTVRSFVSTPRGRRTFLYLHDDDSAAGRAFSRMGHSDVARLKPMTPLRPLMQASVKPPSPLLTPQQQPLKPTTPPQPKNTPKTPISHPQRRRRFQLKLDLREQRRQGFQPHTGTSEQRRQGLQTTAPPGRQNQAAAPWAATTPSPAKCRT